MQRAPTSWANLRMAETYPMGELNPERTTVMACVRSSHTPSPAVFEQIPGPGPLWWQGRSNSIGQCSNLIQSRQSDQVS